MAITIEFIIVNLISNTGILLKTVTQPEFCRSHLAWTLRGISLLQLNIPFIVVALNNVSDPIVAALPQIQDGVQSLT